MALLVPNRLTQLGTFLCPAKCDSLATQQIYFSALWDRPGFATLALFTNDRLRAKTRGKTGEERGKAWPKCQAFPFCRRAPSDAATRPLLENPNPNGQPRL